METKPISSCCSIGIAATTNVVSSSDGLNKISQLALDIFAIIEHTWTSLCAGLTTLAVCFKSVVDVTNIVNLIKRVRDWATPDEDGKMVWEKAWQSIASTIGLTGYNALTVVVFLATTLKVFSLGAALAPVVVATSIFLIGHAVFDFWSNANKISETNDSIKKLTENKDGWSKLFQSISGKQPLPDSWNKFVQDRKAIWERKVTNLQGAQGDKEKLALALKLKAKWEAIEKCDDSAKIKGFCGKTVEVLEAKIANQKTSKAKTWITIAFEIALIAQSVFTAVAAFVAPVGLAMALFLAVAITTGILDLSTNFAEELFKPKALPIVEVPV